MTDQWCLRPPYCSGARVLCVSALVIMSCPNFLLLMLNSAFIRVMVLIFSMSYSPAFFKISTSDIVSHDLGENPYWYGRDHMMASNSAMVGSCVPAM